MSFLDLVKYANIKSPFDPKVFEEVANKINHWLTENSLQNQLKEEKESY